MKRIGLEKRDYYFSPLPDTPFSLGLAIPSDYGDYQVGVKDVVNERFLTYTSYGSQGNPLDDYFRDPEWKLHPQWYVFHAECFLYSYICIFRRAGVLSLWTWGKDSVEALFSCILYSIGELGFPVNVVSILDGSSKNHVSVLRLTSTLPIQYNRQYTNLRMGNISSTIVKVVGADHHWERAVKKLYSDTGVRVALRN